jgi:beta-glucuronidase
MSTRRQFLSAGTASLAARATAQAQTETPPPISAEVSLDGAWLFRLDADADWRTVHVPHTWQVQPARADYYGLAWYRRAFDAPRVWSDSAVRVEFEAVFHTATIWVNGQLAGEHAGKGYTAFTPDIGRFLRYGAENTLEVKVDNQFHDAMLPRGRSSDWAHDGGIYRPVRLLVTPKLFLDGLAVDADPDLAAGTASIAVTATVRNTTAAPATARIGYRVIDEETGREVLAVPDAASTSVEPGETAAVVLRRSVLRNPRLWHFDHPHLYRLEATIRDGHTLATTFGVRKIEVRGTAFYFNGERVRLMGVERMAGSNPEFGMAEPSQWIAHDHADMQELNCVYTRVHWPQDRRTLDWCDRHGILIQTEVPTWGPGTFRGMTGEPSAAILNNGLEQLREMIARDRNHPCIFSWGVCNEIGGQNPPAYAFAKRMYEEAKRLDPARLVTYASHSLFQTPARDVAGLMDYVMFNEYVESWQKGTVEDLARYVDEIHRAFPNKPLVISEYGYCACTPDRPEGDAKRVSVLLGHDRVLRERDYIAGLIFFCYNDYRTHVGDRGTGALKQRVHGVVDLYGNRKASFEQLRRESSPIEVFTVERHSGKLAVRLKTRATVPAYTLSGYKLRAVVFGYGEIPVERIEFPLPDLKPGQETSAEIAFHEPKPVRITLDVLRPSGTSALSATAPTP